MGNTVDLYANGKLLLTGEYLVLAGARALAFPVRYGQRMIAIQHSGSVIDWTSRDSSGIWYQSRLTLPFTANQDKADPTTSFVIKLLSAASSLNPAFLTKNKGYTLDFELNYPREWGLGSSSTLIWLIARLAGVDEFKLYHLVSQGSGYDVACASRLSPFFYTIINHMPIIECTSIGRALQDHACFAYLGKKQDTQSEVQRFLAQPAVIKKQIQYINILSEAISKEDDEVKLCQRIQEHENIIAEIIGKEPVARQFPGFPGTVKSLGAWGGDFAMFVSNCSNEKIKDILKGYGLQAIFTFSELSLSMEK